MLPFAALFNHSTTAPHVHVMDAPADDEDDADRSNQGSAEGSDISERSTASTDVEHESKTTHLQVVM